MLNLVEKGNQDNVTENRVIGPKYLVLRVPADGSPAHIITRTMSNYWGHSYSHWAQDVRDYLAACV